MRENVRSGPTGSGLRHAAVRRRVAWSRRPAATGSSVKALVIAFFALAGSLGALSSSASDAREAAESAGVRKARKLKELAGRREFMIQSLHDYWTKGDFVENPDPSGGPGNFILDARGKPCPLASIIIHSGEAELVEEAARKNNGVKIVDLREGPILEWILHSGLTQEECVLIQRPSTSGADLAQVRKDAERKRLASELEEVESFLRNSTKTNLAVALRRLQASERRHPAARS